MPLFRPFSGASTPTPPEPTCASVTSTAEDNEGVSWNVVNTADTSTPASDYDPNHPAHLTDDTSSFDTDTFPSHAHLFPPETNGTWRTATAHSIRHPSTINWAAAGSALAEVAISASEQAGEALNRVCEGHDVVEMGNRVADLFPKASMPTMRQLDRTVDWIGDAVQGFTQRWSRPFTLRRVRSAPQLRVAETPGRGETIVCRMSRSVCCALVTQGICASFQLSIGHPSTVWQTRLSVALTSFFSSHVPIYGAEAVSTMRPVWIAGMERRLWVLALDTGLVEIDTDGEGHETMGKAVLLDVGFELEEFQLAVDDDEEWVDTEEFKV